MRLILGWRLHHCGRAAFWPFHHLLRNGPLSALVDWFTEALATETPTAVAVVGGGGRCLQRTALGAYLLVGRSALPQLQPRPTRRCGPICWRWRGTGIAPGGGPGGWMCPMRSPRLPRREFPGVWRAERRRLDRRRGSGGRRPWPCRAGLFFAARLTTSLAWAILGWVGARQVADQMLGAARPCRAPLPPLDQAGFRAGLEEGAGVWYGPAINRASSTLLLTAMTTPRALQCASAATGALAWPAARSCCGCACLYLRHRDWASAGGTEPACPARPCLGRFSLGARNRCGAAGPG